MVRVRLTMWSAGQREGNNHGSSGCMAASDPEVLRGGANAGHGDRARESTMELWMYLVVIGMILIAVAGSVWMTLWTVQRGERARSERQGGLPASPSTSESEQKADA